MDFYFHDGSFQWDCGHSEGVEREKIMHQLRPDQFPVELRRQGVLKAIDKLQQIMVSMDLSPDQLVVCAEIVRDNHRRVDSILTKLDHAPPPKHP